MQDDIADATIWARPAGPRGSEAHLHRGRQLRRLRHADGPGALPRPVSLRRRLRGGDATSTCCTTSAGAMSASEYKTYGMPELIGDPVADAEQLKATSPLLQAAHITRPFCSRTAASIAACPSTTRPSCCTRCSRLLRPFAFTRRVRRARALRRRSSRRSACRSSGVRTGRAGSWPPWPRGRGDGAPWVRRPRPCAAGPLRSLSYRLLRSRRLRSCLFGLLGRGLFGVVGGFSSVIS